jgi:hypothetical protein
VKLTRTQVLIACLGLIALQTAILLAMGREPIRKCGCQALVRRCDEFGELAVPLQLVLALPYHPRLHLLLAALARVPFRADVLGTRLVLAIAIEVIENTVVPVWLTVNVAVALELIVG